MSKRTVISLIGAALLAGAASAAHAEGKTVTDFTVRSDPSAISSQGTKSLKWDARRGRWARWNIPGHRVGGGRLDGQRGGCRAQTHHEHCVSSIHLRHS